MQNLKRILGGVIREAAFHDIALLSCRLEDTHCVIEARRDGLIIKRYLLKPERYSDLKKLLSENKVIYAGGLPLELAEEPGGLQLRIVSSIPENAGQIIAEPPFILLVEDDLDQGEMIALMLKEMKYEVSVARNGEEALEAIAVRQPALIISDIMMPKMDGYEFVKRLKRNPALASIPVLMLTVISDSEKEFELLSLGVDDYCQKTVQKKILMKRVENLIKKSSL